MHRDDLSGAAAQAAVDRIADALLDGDDDPATWAAWACDVCVDEGWCAGAWLAWDGPAAEPAWPPGRAGAAGPPPGERVLVIGTPAHRWGRLHLWGPHDGAQAEAGLAAMLTGLVARLATRRRQLSMQVALKNAEDVKSQFQRLFDTTPVSTAIIAPGGLLLDVNRAFVERVGLSREDAIGRRIGELNIGLSDADRKTFIETLRRDRRVRNLRMRSRPQQSTEPHDVLINASYVIYDGQECGLISVLDISDMQRAEIANAARIRAEAESQAKGEMLARVAKEKAESDRLREAADRARAQITELSETGREVMASLDTSVVVARLGEGIARLMPADAVRVYGVDAHDGELALIGSWGDADGLLPAGAPRPGLPALGGWQGLAALAAGEPARWPEAPAGARAARFAPLVAQGGPFGLIAVYARAEGGDGHIQSAVLAALSLHAGGAIVNSRTYQQLTQAQDQLIEREKMAALGSLVAGVAHELNTPLGNALLLASHLQACTRELASGAAPPPGLVDNVREAGELIVSSLQAAATLVSSFKQVAVDQTADRRRRFMLHALCHEVAVTMRNQLQPHGHQLVVEVPEGITMDSYPGALVQILTNLIANAMSHGFDGRRQGRMTLEATVRRGEVALAFSDDGRGIEPAHLRRVFEPFFTTRLGSGGSGLGLSISYSLVTAVLGGTIGVRSVPGAGARFELVLPLVAPARRGDAPA